MTGIDLCKSFLSEMTASTNDRETGMASAKSEEEWAERVRTYLKAELQKAEVTYTELAKRLKRHGFKDETEASITAKLKRGTFSAAFLLAALTALEAEGLSLEDV
jgi:hypothetical protein